MNPLRWKREDQLAWAVVSLVGAVLGLLLSFMHMRFFSVLHMNEAFMTWLSFSGTKWYWSLVGFCVAALAFYAGHFNKGSN
jgi:hypothetical protein